MKAKKLIFKLKEFDTSKFEINMNVSIDEFDVIKEKDSNSDYYKDHKEKPSHYYIVVKKGLGESALEMLKKRETMTERDKERFSFPRLEIRESAHDFKNKYKAGMVISKIWK